MKGTTVRRLLAVLAVIAGAVLIDNYGGAASYLLFYTTLLIPLLSFIYRRTGENNLRVIFTVKKPDIVKGESCPCELSIVNDGILPFPYVRVKLTEGKLSFAESGEEMKFSLKPHEVLKIPLELSCDHCGSGKAGAESVTIYDIFYLGHREKSDKTYIAVRPRMPRLKELVIAPGAEREQRRRSLQYKPADIPDGQIRPYVNGDDLRKIHWKATALQGKPMMRQFITEPRDEVVIIPDTRASLPEGQLGWASEDAILEGVLAIADYYRRAGTPTRVITAGGKSMNLTGNSGYEALYKLCCGDFFKGTDRPDRVLDRDIRSGGAGSSYILITWEIDEAFIRSLSMASELGAKISVLYICDGVDERMRALMNSNRRVEFRIVPMNSDILDVLGGTENGGGEE